MVDISNKLDSSRLAVAKGEVVMRADTLAMIKEGTTQKGDVLSVAQVAGVMAAKRTSDIIPLCHPLPINQIKINFEIDEEIPGIGITATAKTFGKTGVEMEALTAVAIAALTIYDMVKAVEKTINIQNIRLVEKHGGQSGSVVNE
jgi:cyclic pyranopterin phosphate synthase